MPEPLFAQPPPVAGMDHEGERIARWVADVVRATAASSPRNRQKTIGPSQIGHPCPRRVVYTLLDWPKTAAPHDPLAAVIGTAMHAWLADAFTRLNELLPAPRFLVEHRVWPTDGISGCADLYDIANGGAVYDWKVVGKAALDRVRRSGPGVQYAAQAALYGLGFERAGLPVAQTAIVFLPRTGYLSGIHVWHAAYFRPLALAAVERLEALTIAADALSLDDDASGWARVPAVPSHACRFCPWQLPGSVDFSQGCPGDLPSPLAGTAPKPQ